MKDRDVTIVVVILLAFAASTFYGENYFNKDQSISAQAFYDNSNSKCAQLLTREKVSVIGDKVERKTTNYDRYDEDCVAVDYMNWRELLKKFPVYWDGGSNTDIVAENNIYYVDVMFVHQGKDFKSTVSVPDLENIIVKVEQMRKDFVKQTAEVIKEAFSEEE